MAGGLHNGHDTSCQSVRLTQGACWRMKRRCIFGAYHETISLAHIDIGMLFLCFLTLCMHVFFQLYSNMAGVLRVDWPMVAAYRTMSVCVGNAYFDG